MTATTAPSLGAPPPTLVDAWQLSPVYQKYLDVEGVPVLATRQISDAALHEAAYLTRKMIGHRPEVLSAIAVHRVRIVVMAPTEMTTDVPEHSDLTPKAYWDRRARGLGATEARPATSCGEENLLGLDGDPYATENILVHELSHTIHQLGMNDVDATFDARLIAAYQHARDTGLWAKTYAMENPAEYWAEGAQSWFDTNRVNDDQHGPVGTREQLVAYDPDLASLLGEVFGDRAWRYQPVAARESAERAHLGGFDRATAARFDWPDQPAPDAATVTLSLVAVESAPTFSPRTAGEAVVMFTNHRAEDVDLEWLDFAGQRVHHARVRPGGFYVQSTYVGHVWVVQQGGADLGVVVAVDGTGQLDIE